MHCQKIVSGTFKLVQTFFFYYYEQPPLDKKVCLPFHAELEAKFSKGEHTRWTPTSYNLPLLLEQKQAREQKQPWGVVMGSGASERRTSALAARMNGIKGGGGGGTLLQLHCPPLPLATRT